MGDEFSGAEIAMVPCLLPLAVVHLLPASGEGGKRQPACTPLMLARVQSFVRITVQCLNLPTGKLLCFGSPGIPMVRVFPILFVLSH